MAKDKFKKRKNARRDVRAEMVRIGLTTTQIARELGVSHVAVSKGCATVPRIIAALIAHGVPKRVFEKLGKSA